VNTLFPGYKDSGPLGLVGKNDELQAQLRRSVTFVERKIKTSHPSPIGAERVDVQV
jgi:hypothetical protein